MTLVNRFFSYVNQQPKVRRQCFGLFLTRFFPHDTTIHMYIYISIYRVVGNWWEKRKGSDSTRRKKSKM